MHFYSHLITVMFPYVILNTDNTPPVGEKYVIDYTGAQVVTYTGDFVTAV